MDVAVTDLRAHLSHWLARAGAGDEIVVTDRGVPVARLVGVEASVTLARLTEEGVIGRPEVTSRPSARGLRRPRVRRSAADLVGDQRR